MKLQVKKTTQNKNLCLIKTSSSEIALGFIHSYSKYFSKTPLTIIRRETLELYNVLSINFVEILISSK